MNIHINYIIAVFSGCIFTAQAHIESCKDLIVHVSDVILKDYNVSLERTQFNHGSYYDCKTESPDFAYETDVCLTSSFWYGPDANVVFERKTDRQLVTIRVQQNLCGLAAGKITVQPIHGEWKYYSLKGEFQIKPGEVWLYQVSLNN